MAISGAAKQDYTIDSTGSSSTGRALAMVTMLFFIWGFLTSLNDILVPHLQDIFNLNYFQSGLIQFAFFSSYFVFSLPAGKIVESIGYKKTMVVGLLVMAVGAFLFLPAAAAPSYPLFLGALIVLAAGVTVLQVAANPYVSVLGPASTASSRLNLTQAFNSLGTTLAPFFGSVLILRGVDLSAEKVNQLSNAARIAYHQNEASSVRMPYIGIGLTLILVAVAIAIFKLPKIQATQEFRPMGDTSNPMGSVFAHRNLVLGVVAIFLYVGAEVSIGSYLIKYFVQPDTGNLSIKTAANYVAFYWGGAMIGRFIGAGVLQKVKTSSAVGFVAIMACLLTVVSIFSFGSIAVWSILLVGLFNSIMFPSIFTLGIAGLGPLTGKGSGLLVMGIVGGALIPLAEGRAADMIGLHHAFIIPAICYIYIAYYGFIGSRPTGKQAKLAPVST
jgi:FHS family L-fucose permease-like MFS transporter